MIRKAIRIMKYFAIILMLIVFNLIGFLGNNFWKKLEAFTIVALILMAVLGAISLFYLFRKHPR